MTPTGSSTAWQAAISGTPSKSTRTTLSLPQRIKVAIEAPNINLVKLAPYRTHLGINDKKIEEEQGVKFVRIASTRNVNLGEPEMANVPALELGPFPAQ